MGEKERPVSMIKKSRIFLSETKTELKKVSWTKKDELLASTSVVIVTVIILGLYIGVVDVVLTRIIDFILK